MTLDQPYATLRDHGYGDNLFFSTSAFAGTHYAYPKVMTRLKIIDKTYEIPRT